MSQKININFEENSYKKYIKTSIIKEWTCSILKEMEKNDFSISFLFCSNETMRRLNNDFRKKDYITDVLSFSQEDDGISFEPDFIGDSAICVPQAVLQAVNAGHSEESEIKFLILHSILHLLGYDHETDKGEMEEIERNIFYKLTGESIE